MTQIAVTQIAVTQIAVVMLVGTVGGMARETRIDSFTETATNVLQADVRLISRCVERLHDGSVMLLGISGKLASGKDAVAAEVMRHLGAGDALHWSYARPMRAEVDQIIAVLADTHDHDAAARGIATEQGVELAHAEHVAAMLLPALEVSPELSSWHRTPVMRAVLQYWGTQVRRAQDDNYWVKRALGQVLPAIAEGRSVYFTDLRFPNEVEYPRRLGFLTVRITVTAEVQAQRLYARDGLAPNPETMNHQSETALDSYDGFDLVVSNDGPIEHAVGEIVSALRH